MAWQDEIPIIFRSLVGDMDATRYSNDSVKQILVVAAFQVAAELSFDFMATPSSVSIVPDPTATETKDDSFVNLICLKAACMSDRGAAILAAKQGIFVKDGPSSIDLRGPMQGALALLAKGYCSAYEDARIQYLSGAGVVAGAAVMGPFRMFAFGGFESPLGGRSNGQGYFN